MSDAFPAIFLAWARYASSLAGTLAISAPHLKRNGIGAVHGWRLHALRTLLVAVSMTLFFEAISTTALTTAMGGYFTGPIVAALLACLFLGERITPTRTLSWVGGGLGAVLILRPTFGFDIGGALALLSGFFFGGYLVVTRLAARGDDPFVTLIIQLSLGTLFLTPFALVTWITPTGTQALLCLLMGAISAPCHYLIIRGFKWGEASVLATFVYLELVSATLIGYLAFSDTINMITWTGIACVVASGALLTLRRPAVSR